MSRKCVEQYVQIVVQNLNILYEYYFRYPFLCDEWLSKNRKDCDTKKLLPVAGADNIKTFRRLFTCWMRTKFFDDHVWFSVFVRPLKSNFTRAQRLTCCLMFLYLMMVANAMWYKDSASDTPELFTIHIGPIVITYTMVYVSIASSLILLPVTMATVEIFKRSTSSFRYKL